MSSVTSTKRDGVEQVLVMVKREDSIIEVYLPNTLNMRHFNYACYCPFFIKFSTIFFNYLHLVH